MVAQNSLPVYEFVNSIFQSFFHLYDSLFQICGRQKTLWLIARMLCSVSCRKNVLYVQCDGDETTDYKFIFQLECCQLHVNKDKGLNQLHLSVRDIEVSNTMNTFHIFSTTVKYFHSSFQLHDLIVRHSSIPHRCPSTP